MWWHEEILIKGLKLVNHQIIEIYLKLWNNVVLMGCCYDGLSTHIIVSSWKTSAEIKNMNNSQCPVEVNALWSQYTESG